MTDINLNHMQLMGKKLRAIRQERNMSLRELASTAEMSASMLSQIETGKSWPSVRSMYSIAAALNVPVDYFFPDQDVQEQPANGMQQPSEELTASEMREMHVGQATTTVSKTSIHGEASQAVVHPHERPTIELKGGVTWARLTALAEPDAEFLEITYAPGASSGAHLSHHEGREFGVVLEGELFIELGFEVFTVRCGDSIVFDSKKPHRLSNQSDKPVRALWVVLNRL